MIGSTVRLIARQAHLNWALADQGMVSGVNFATGIMLARFLGLEEFGRFTLAWMAVLFVNSIQHALIISPMMSFGPKQDPGEQPTYYAAVATQQLAFGAATLALMLGAAAVAAAIVPHWNIGELALPLACAAIAFQVQNFLRRYFFTHGRGGMAFAIDALRYGGQFAFLFWLFESTAMDSATTLWVIAAMAAIAALVFLPACERMTWCPAAIRATTKRHWHFGKWLTAAELLQWTSCQLFFIVAGGMLGAAAVGALRAAQNLMGFVHILFMGLENIVPTAAARHFHIGGAQRLRTYLLRVTIYGELATGAVAAVMFVAPDFWLELAFGEEYDGYGYLLQWWAVTYFMIFLILPLTAGIRATDHTRTTFVAYLAVTAFSTVAVYPLIFMFGLNGVMAGLFCAYAVLIFSLWRGLMVPMRLGQR